MDVVSSLDIADRILALQAVPMFSGLAVSDLEQIAEAVVERRYEPHEIVFRRGDWEDDMIMIVSGEVSLTGDVPMAPRGPGEHIGELAMLRHQPRSLTATAGADGMHGLAIDCQVLETLIEERPQIATTMLGTLADLLAASE
jgi:CRP-like cAMP-binding protein